MKNTQVMFTVDVETDWGGKETRGVLESLPQLIRLLRRYSVRATFFVVANLVPLVRDQILSEGPDEVGSHGLTHTLLTRLSPQDVAFEIEESKRILEAEGYQVAGFRAPFFRSPPQLPDLLARAGYGYDASCGSVYPRPKKSGAHPVICNTQPPIYQIETSTLNDGLTPFSLTYLRLYHPIGLRLVSARAQLFYCHLHELLEPEDGWQRLPPALRRLHQRNSGAKAWSILEELMRLFGQRFVSCRDYLATFRNKEAI